MHAYRAYRAGEAVLEPGLAAAASTTEIARARFVLFPGRYVPPAGGGESKPPRARLRRLAAEWADLAGETERLVREIREMDLGA